MSQDTKFQRRLGTPQYYSLESGTGVILCGDWGLGTAYRDVPLCNKIFVMQEIPLRTTGR